MKLGSQMAIILLSLVSIAHLFRIILQTEVVVSGVAVGLWISVLGCLIPATIVVLLVIENRQTRGDAN